MIRLEKPQGSGEPKSKIEVIKSWSKDTQKQALSVLIQHRVLTELCLVGILHRADDDGNVLTHQDLLVDLERGVEGERILIGLLGRREAARIYGRVEGVSSSAAAMNFVLTNDFVGYYQALPVSGEQA